MPAQGLAGWASQLFEAVDAHQTLTVCAAALALSRPNSYLFLVSVPGRHALVAFDAVTRRWDRRSVFPDAVDSAQQTVRRLRATPDLII